EAQLVDGDAQILHLVEGEPEAAGQSRGRQPHEAQVLRCGRHAEADVATASQGVAPRFLVLIVAHHRPAPHSPVQDHVVYLFPILANSNTFQRDNQMTPARRHRASSSRWWPRRPAKTASLSAPGARPRWRTAPGVATRRD